METRLFKLGQGVSEGCEIVRTCPPKHFENSLGPFFKGFGQETPGKVSQVSLVIKGHGVEIESPSDAAKALQL